MRTSLFPLACLPGLLLLFSACTDSPIQPESEPAIPVAGTPVLDGQQVQGCVLEGFCVLDPVSPAPCDPWEDLSWCSGDDCMTSVLQPADPTLQSCPGGGGGGAPGGGGTPSTPPDPGTICLMADTGSCPAPPDSMVCEVDCPAEEETDSDICPEPLRGRTLTYLAHIAGRNHEFKFTGTMRRVNPLVGRSPAWYTISGPTLSKDAWWMAESGTIQLVCWGRWTLRNSLWVGTVVVQDDDLHMVMAPGHPDF